MGLRAFTAALLAAVVAGAPAHAQTPDAASEFSAGVEAYRRGDYETARARWLALADDPLAKDDRATLLYDLGNAAFRTGRVTEAVAWYTSSIRFRPRDADAWANLEFARRQAGLEPADKGDLGSTLQRLLTSLDRDEAAWLVVASLGLLLVAFAGEALRGGALWRRLALVAFGWTVLSAAPLAWQLVRRAEDPWMVIELPAAGLRSEPREESPAVTQALAGSELERIDELPGWVRLETPEGMRGWVPEDSAIALRVPR